MALLIKKAPGFRHSGLLGFASIALVALAGCNGRTDLGQVTGRVTLDGQPLENACLEFVPLEGHGSNAFGRCDSDGNYAVMFAHNAKGATLGKNRVRITTRDVYQDSSGREAWSRERVPARYNTRSELDVSVQPGANVFDFSLETGAGKSVPSRVAP